ncbi:MAG: hypothetical protein AB9872_17220 [Solidesulfovibrio sp.]
MVVSLARLARFVGWVGFGLAFFAEAGRVMYAASGDFPGFESVKIKFIGRDGVIALACCLANEKPQAAA